MTPTPENAVVDKPVRGPVEGQHDTWFIQLPSQSARGMKGGKVTDG